MLVLSRKTQESIQIGNDITVTILRVKGNIVRIGIEAPPTTRIMRKEIAHLSPKEKPTEAEMLISMAEQDLELVEPPVIDLAGFMRSRNAFAKFKKTKQQQSIKDDPDADNR